MKRRLLSILLSMVMLVTLFSSICTVASATTVRDLSGYIVDSKDPQTLGHWEGYYTSTTTDGANNSRIIECSGTRTDTHLSLSIPQSAVNTNASAKPYILHLSYRIQNDRTNPAYITHRIQYKKSDNTGLFNDLFVTNTSQFTLNLDTSKNITTFGTSAYNYLDAYDYKVDLYKNLKTGAYQIYLNGVKWINAYDYSTAKTIYSGEGGSSEANTINEYRIRVTGSANSSWAFKLVNPCYEIYSQDVLMDEVVAYSLSGMSNYLNATGPSEAVESKLGRADNITVSPSSGTASTSYTATNVSSGAQLLFWEGTGDGTSDKNKPMVGEYAASGKEWYHMGFDITGSNVGLKLIVNVKKNDNTNGGDWEVIPAHTGSNYRVDYVFDLANRKGYVYYNRVYDSVVSLNFRQFRQIKLTTTTTTNFTISNISFNFYAKGVDPGDILIGYESRSTTNPDYIYQISGIQSGTNVIGRMGGVCSVSGDNSSGYTLAPNSIDGTKGGFAIYTLNYTEKTSIYQSTDDKVLWHTVYYKPQTVSNSSMHQIGVRGGTGDGGYYWLLNAENGAFYLNSTNEYIKPYNTSTFYKIDFVLNNKDYKYYLLLDGVCVESGTLYSARQPIWDIAYTMWNASDRMVLKNVQTTLYKNNYDEKDIAVPQLTRVFANNESCTVSNGSAAVTTSFIGPAGNANTKILYGIYNSSGDLLKYQAVDSASGYINGSNRSDTISIPTGGATLKVFMWNLNTGSNIQTPLSNAITKSLQ